MKPALVDTDILSFFFKGHPAVVARFAEYTRLYETINFSIITYYEILSGLKHRDAHRKLETFLSFAAENTILPFTQQAATHAAEQYAALCKRGMPLDDIDLLIAGIALANDLVMVTHNIDHFTRISELDVENWTKGANYVIDAVV